MSDPPSGDGCSAVSLGPVVRQTGWSTLEKVGNHGLRFAFLLVLARLLAPEAFGVLAEALVVTSLLKTVAGLGLETSLVQEDEVGTADFSTASVASAVLSLSLVGGAALLGPVAAAVFEAPILVGVVPAVALAPALSNATLSPRARLRRGMNFRSLALASLVGTLVGGGTAVVAAYRGFGVWSLVIQLVVDAFVTAIWVWGAGGVTFADGISWSRLKRLLRFGGPFTAEQILNFLNRRSDDFIIGVFIGGTALGYYRIAYTGLQALTRILSGSLTAVALPVFSRAASDLKRLRNQFLRSTEVAALLALPACAGFGIVADMMIPVFFGAEWLPAVPAAQVLSIVAFFHIVLRFSPTAMYALGRSDLQLRLSVLYAVLNVVGFLIGVQWGIVGVATAFAVQNLITAPVELGVLKGLISFRVGSYLEKFWRPALAGTAMVALILGFRTLSALGPGAELALSVIVGASGYVAALVALGPSYLVGLLSDLGSSVSPGTGGSSSEAAGA